VQLVHALADMLTNGVTTRVFVFGEPAGLPARAAEGEGAAFVAGGDPEEAFEPGAVELHGCVGAPDGCGDARGGRA